MSGTAPPASICIIGLGAIGKIVLEGIESARRASETGGERDSQAAEGGGDQAGAPHVVALVVREAYVEAARTLAPEGTSVITNLDDLEPGALDLVVECAGHDTVRGFGERALLLGADLMVIATGALADDGLRTRLSVAAEKSETRILLPAGAIAGLDGLTALRRGGLSSVRYVASKPPDAWVGTPAEAAIDLKAVESPAAFFTGSAGEAARLYPKNANIAATVALAGLGFDETEVELVADPTTADNVGRIEAIGALGRMELELRGPPMTENPKTSVITAYSVLEAIESPHRTIVV